ncbi:MAG: 16S rRNA (uracil(1498)-N(3))-methyltransferase [Alphaproteobacteria bacterium]
MLRLFIAQIADEIIIEDKQFHYISNVMKKKTDEEILVFDGISGEYIYKIKSILKKTAVLEKVKKIKDFEKSLDVWLLFAPLKKEATDFVIEKATELGVKKFVPIITKRVNNHNFNIKRAHLQAIEASEQCERLDVPEILEPQNLSEVLKKWDSSRALCPLLERTDAKTINEVFSQLKTDKVAIVVGPEGGFDDKEKELLKQYQPISMGKRILRAETASISALACYQAIKGDFNS